MTCILAVKRNGKIVIAGDRAASAGLDVSVRKHPKIFKVDEFHIGYSGSFRMGQLLQFKLKAKHQTAKQSDFEYMVTTFIDTVKAMFEENSFGEKDEGGFFLVVYRGEIYKIESDFHVGCCDRDYESVGTGGRFAEVTVKTLLDVGGQALETVVMKAMENAAFFDQGVKAPFDIITIEKKNKIGS